MILDSTYCFSVAPHLRWKDLRYALEHGCLLAESIVEYALDSLVSESPPLHYELATERSPRAADVLSVLDKLIYRYDMDKGDDSESLREIWLYLMLNWLYVHKDEYLDPFEVIGEIYSDFDYPEDLAPLVRYMPPKDGSPAGEAAMMHNWEFLLSTLKSRMQKHCLVDT